MESAIFLFTRCVLAFFRVNPAYSFNQPNYLIRSACFHQSSGQPRVNPGKQEGGGAKKIEKIGEFSFRGILQPTTGQESYRGPQPRFLARGRPIVLGLDCKSKEKRGYDTDGVAYFICVCCVHMKYTTPAQQLYSARMLSRPTTAVLGTCEANCPSARLQNHRAKAKKRGVTMQTGLFTLLEHGPRILSRHTTAVLGTWEAKCASARLRNHRAKAKKRGVKGALQLLSNRSK